MPPGAAEGRNRGRSTTRGCALTEREPAKAAELTAAGKASARTVRRMRHRYRDAGAVGPGRHAACPRRPGRSGTCRPAGRGGRGGGDRRADRHVDRDPGPGLAAGEVIDWLEASRAGQVPVPSRATFYRLLAVLSAGRHTFGSAVQPARRREPAGRGVHRDDRRPARGAGADGRHAAGRDGGDGRRGDRPSRAGAAVDVATRTICAAVLRPVGAKAVDAALLLARMMVPEPMRPGWDQALAMSASRMPHRRLVSIDSGWSWPRPSPSSSRRRW